jgi:hypothetical protein
MIEPVSFQLNKETAVNNYYQNTNNSIPLYQVQQIALEEFNLLKKILQNKGINVISVKDTKNPETPDALFPNNWISFHKDRKAILYPMFAKNRRYERRNDIINLIISKGFKIDKTIDYSDKEKQNQFLEGTGSMVLDRKNKIAYCSLSARSNKNLFLQFCLENDFKPISFTSYQTVNNSRKPIYHTNVMMSIGVSYVMVCFKSIDDVNEREYLKRSLINSDKEIIELSEQQIANFAGNSLQLKGKPDNIIVMSERAKKSLNELQIKQLKKHGKIVSIPIPVIEDFGGGSVRCMLAEIF